MNQDDIEKKWQKKWKESDLYKVKEDSKKPKFYILDMFPYPSGAGLHVGHPKGYIASDTLARKKMLQGFNVLHPMGFDTFGLGTENYAIEHKMKPQDVAKTNIATYIKQLELLGTTYDRSRSVNTADPEYFKRTQRIFLQFFNHYYDELAKKAKPIEELKLKIENGKLKISEDVDTYLNNQRLAYIDYKPINRCPKCMTGLANEDLDDGKCERCGSEVEQKPMKQWVLRITKYAERLLEGLEKLHRDEAMKDLERNWIGKKEGINIHYPIAGTGEEVVCFTTRPDTNFGATFVVIAPEHPFVTKILNKELDVDPKTYTAIESYVAETKQKTELQRIAEGRVKTGAFTGFYADHRLCNTQIPIWISDFVLAGFGTGAVVGVPGHDLRDFEFAQTFKLPTIRVVVGSDGDTSDITQAEQVQEEEGTMINSSFLDGMDIHVATKKIIEQYVAKGRAEKVISYRMQDRVFSRQRYRGEPFPILRAEAGGLASGPQNGGEGKLIPIPLDEKDLPLLLPDVDNYEPTGTEEGPLANISDRVNVTLPDGTKAKRETNTMPGRAGSSRYRLRYMDPTNDKALVGKDKEAYWQNVDVYIGGAEHICRHILYGRFWQQFLYDIGVVTKQEPFQEYHSVGLIMGEDGRKMSKRRGNVVNPDELIKEYGADSLRTYEMFMGPFDQPIAWNTNGIKGVKKFLDKVVALYDKVSDAEESNETKILVHQTIKKLTDDIDEFRFNTAVSQLMILVNHLTEIGSISRSAFESLVILAAPFAPHLAEELWERLGNEYSIFGKAKWPKYDEKYLVADTITIAVQVNGKVRGTISLSVDADEKEAMAAAKADTKIAGWITSEPKKIIYVKGKILNIVV